MSSLILELQRDAIDEQISITALLRKSLVVATKLSLDDFRRWVSCELAGFDKNDEIPDYRLVHGEVCAWNDVRRQWIPFIFEPEVTRQLSQRRCAQRISEIEMLAKKEEGKGVLAMASPPELRNRVGISAIVGAGGDEPTAAEDQDQPEKKPSSQSCHTQGL